MVGCFIFFAGNNKDLEKYFWEALSQATSEQLSKILRFWTGNTRLPEFPHMRVYWSMNCGECCILIVFLLLFSLQIDCRSASSLPESHTCSSQIDIPDYPNAKIMKEKLVYASENCVAIDADGSASRSAWADAATVESDELATNVVEDEEVGSDMGEISIF